MTPPLTSDEALRRNDRYLTEVVEAYNLCPFAKSCRSSGQLRRIVIPGDQPERALYDMLTALQASEDGDFEVALLIAPEFAGSPHDWERLCAATQADATAQLRAQQREPSCHVVAFHPQLPWSSATPHALVGLLRHSPDPTWQMVRRSVLDRVRGTAGELRFVDPGDFANLEALLAAANALTMQPPLADRIASANLRTWHADGPALERHLAEIEADRSDQGA